MLDCQGIMRYFQALMESHRSSS